MWSIKDNLKESPIDSFIITILIWFDWFLQTITFGLIPKIGGDLEILASNGLFKFILDKNKQNNGIKQYQKFRFGHIPVVLVFDGVLSKQILVSNARRGKFYKLLRIFFGDGIFTSWNKPLWKHQRTGILKLFNTKTLRNITPELTNSMFTELDRIALDKECDLVAVLSKIGLVAFCEVIFGVNVRDISDDLIEPLNKLLVYINNAVEPINIKIGSKYHEFVQNRDIVHDWMKELIKRARVSKQCHNIINNELNNFDISEQQLIEFVLSVVLGGHETTARLMLGIIYSVAQNDNIIKKLNNETDKYHENHDTYDIDIMSRPYLSAIINEGTRLFPPVWLLSREVQNDFIVEEKLFKKGTQFLISPLIYLRDPKIWGNNSEEFNPDHFIEGVNNLKPKQKENFIPFIVGSENCPGKRFAILESSVVISKLFFEYELNIQPHKLNPMSAGTFRLTDKLPVIIKKRQMI
ncbi:cytochrome p450-like protein [Megavirus baoshan]|uniref:Putative cytochrome p450-like protein n=1 Tax=Megavirus baoshan TaxID=2496520 RepID=A0A3S5HL85_9VIRU|nr:cytochrome p450-like protein [Megavirus baoshan]AZL89209.1 cytochrome p450-like protein [Megavirus baoshan]